MEIGFDEFRISKKDNKYDLPENLVYINDIDEGAFAKVIHVKEKKTKIDYALKIINKSESNIDLINRMLEEIQILKKLQHPNIVKYYGHIENSNQIFIKMEYLKYGTLEQWMKTNKNISEEKASLIIKKLLSAIAYLHQKQICHRDLKPENIMFSKENDLNSIKIIDFGLSLRNFDSLCSSDYCGTLIYMAPEEIERKSYYLSVDIWSIGILMYMLLNDGEHPFYHEKDNKEIFLKNLKENNELKFKNKISYMAIHLIKKLLEFDPIKRYKANDALNHPWITRNPEDNIPQTFNEQLNTFSCINNLKKLMMISIFLNYFKKNYVSTEKIIIKSKELKNKSKSTIYKISDEYIKRCEFFDRVKRDKLKELRIKHLEVKKDPEILEEKKNDIILNKNINNSNIISNYDSSKTNNYFMKNYEQNTLIDNNKTKYFLRFPKNKKAVHIKHSETSNLSTSRIKRKINYSESKKDNINKYLFNNKRKKLNLETETINKEFALSSNKRKLFLIKTSTKDLNNIINEEIDKRAYEYINENINNIKPINLFLREKQHNKFRANIFGSRKNICPNQIEQKFNENEKVNIPKNNIKKLKLPNISYNNIHNAKKSKKNLKMFI